MLRSASVVAASSSLLSTAPQVSVVATAGYFMTIPPEKYFDKLLVANRGEIAIRVFKTAKRLGIKTVAVYSEADYESQHVKFADEAVCIGKPPSKESYLIIDRIIKACKMTGAQVVHPGYGFLSENADFSQALADNKIAYCGPPASAVHEMGDKIISKQHAVKAGVFVVPGSVGVVSREEAARVANEIGYPVMIKAAAGGGGKGMRIVRSQKELMEMFTLATSEASMSFSDDRVMIEKLIDNEPRHIEIQVLADSQGNTLYLNERECSIQRRNQKVIEEAPSVVLDAVSRRRMGEQACALAKAVGYTSAGTVEFLVDADKKWYFLEMNTRLQVEHPITEMTTGIDIVEQMIRVAAGKPLSFKQSDIGIKGHAFETRVYAEDPYKGNLPSIGNLSYYSEPFPGNPDVRADSGVKDGSPILMNYDPLICKLVTHAEDRPSALKLMEDALDEYIIRGLNHNIPLLRDVLSHDRFKNGKLSIKYLPEEYPKGFHGHALRSDRAGFSEASELAAIAATVHSQIHGRTSGVATPSVEKFVVSLDGTDHTTEVAASEDLTSYTVKASGVSSPLSVLLHVPRAFMRDPVIPAVVGDGTTSYTPKVQVLQAHPDGKYVIQYHGTPYTIQVNNEKTARLAKFMHPKVAPDMSGFVVTQMPGRVKSVLVKEGEEVVAGQTVFVLESMKMEIPMTVQKGGIVKKIEVKENDNVTDKTMMLVLETPK